MNRIEAVRKYIDDILLHMQDTEERRCAYIHLYGVAQACAMISLKRKCDTELAVIAGMLHDIHSYSTMDSTDHARKGADMARNILEDTSLFDDYEISMICSAIYNHSDKNVSHSDFDEILKDADVLQHYLYNPLFDVKQTEKFRFENLKKEFDL